MKVKSIVSAVLAMTGVLLGAGVVAADPGYGYRGYGDHSMMWGNWFTGPMMMLFMIVIVVVAVALVAKLLGFSAPHSKADTHGTALTILNERFAKGEIDKAEYEERKKALGA